MTLNSARMTVAYTGQVVDGSPQVSRLDAAGGVTVTRPDQTARSQFAVYDLNKRVITMLGGVSLLQGGNTVNGGRLTINLDTGRAVIDGSAVSGGTPGGVTSSGGRVTGTFFGTREAEPGSIDVGACPALPSTIKLSQQRLFAASLPRSSAFLVAGLIWCRSPSACACTKPANRAFQPAGR